MKELCQERNKRKKTTKILTKTGRDFRGDKRWEAKEVTLGQRIKKKNKNKEKIDRGRKHKEKKI